MAIWIHGQMDIKNEYEEKLLLSAVATTTAKSKFQSMKESLKDADIPIPTNKPWWDKDLLLWEEAWVDAEKKENDIKETMKTSYGIIKDTLGSMNKKKRTKRRT